MHLSYAFESINQVAHMLDRVKQIQQTIEDLEKPSWRVMINPFSGDVLLFNPETPRPHITHTATPQAMIKELCVDKIMCNISDDVAALILLGAYD